VIGWGLQRALMGDIGGGVWIAFVGWFLYSGAEAARNDAMLPGSQRVVHAGIRSNA